MYANDAIVHHFGFSCPSFRLFMSISPLTNFIDAQCASIRANTVFVVKV